MDQSYTRKNSREELLKQLGPPEYEYPELEELSTDTLIAIHEARCRSPSVMRDKAKYLIDKKNDFPNNTYVHYRHLFGIDAFAHDYLTSSGKVDIAYLKQRFPWQEEEEGEGECEGDSSEEEGWDIRDDCDEDGEEEDDDSDEKVKLTKRNTFLLGKQFLLKLIEVEKIEADFEKASVGLAHWAIKNKLGQSVGSIMFLNELISFNLLLNNTILEANKVTQVWKISSHANNDANNDAGKVSFLHLSARAIREEFGILEEGDREMCVGFEVQENKTGRVKAWGICLYNAGTR